MSNGGVLEKMVAKNIHNIRSRQLPFLGSIIRKEFVKIFVLTGRIEGKRQRGKQPINYLASLMSVQTFGVIAKTNFIMCLNGQQIVKRRDSSYLKGQDTWTCRIRFVNSTIKLTYVTRTVLCQISVET